MSRSIRRRCDFSGRLVRPEGEHPVRLIDLSETGAFLESDIDLQIGDLAALHLQLPGGHTWGAEVEIARMGTGHRELRHTRVEIVAVLKRGVGVRFLSISDPERRKLHALLAWLDQG